MKKKPHFEICVKAGFSGAHHLTGYKGDCERPHGHNWDVRIFVECDELNEAGIGIDFYEVKEAVQSILAELDHRDLNTLSQFQHNNPTCENVAAYIYSALSGKLNREGIRITKVGVSETEEFGVFYWQE